MVLPRLGLSLLVAALAIPFTKALVVITPDNETVWDRTGKTKTYIKWGLDPPTDPPPRTNLFTIWLRNGAPDMYDPPLNLTLARHVDFVGKSQVEVQDVIDFLAGPGYQLFLSDPDNSTIVYCESPVFDIEDDPEVALERRRRREAGETLLPSSEPSPEPTTSGEEEPSTSSITEETTTSNTEEEATTAAEEPTRVITQDPEPEPTEPPREEEASGSIEDASLSSWWSDSISSMFSSTTTEEPAPAEDTRREPILRPSPPPNRDEVPKPANELPPSPPSSTSTIEESPPTSTSITPPPPVSSSEPSPPPPPPPPSATIVEPSPPAGSSSRDFYWYYSVSDSPAPEPTPSSNPKAAPSNVATMNANAPCTCGGQNQQNQAVSNVEAGTTFQILIRPMPGSHADEGLKLFTVTGGAASLSSVGIKGLLSFLAGSFFVLHLF